MNKPSFAQQLRKTRYIWLFLLILFFFILTALLAPWLAPFEPSEQNLLGRLKAPGSILRAQTYWLGSDELGRADAFKIAAEHQHLSLAAFACSLNRRRRERPGPSAPSASP